MKPSQLLLAYQRLVERERELRDEIERLETLLASNPDVAAAQEALADAKARHQSLELRLRESDRERETHRGRLRQRERDLMSGRIRSPTELMQLNQEEDAAEEGVRLASSSLDDARTRFAGDEPGLRRELKSLQSELDSVKADGAAAWAQIPANFQAAFLRIRSHPAVAEVERNQCQECHVTVTTSGMQGLRRGEEVVYCENCGRILVIA
jgi:predicted  nucleic acid-binding Zn-ribbon protein